MSNTGYRDRDCVPPEPMSEHQVRRMHPLRPVSNAGKLISLGGLFVADNTSISVNHSSVFFFCRKLSQLTGKIGKCASVQVVAPRSDELFGILVIRTIQIVSTRQGPGSVTTIIYLIDANSRPMEPASIMKQTRWA